MINQFFCDLRTTCKLICFNFGFDFLKETAQAKVDNVRMAGYMEKLPVKSNQKKVLLF